MTMSLHDPHTIADLLDYIEHYCGDIYVREFKDGKVGNYYLSELPVCVVIRHINKWIRNQVVPMRVIREVEEEPPPEKEETA